MARNSRQQAAVILLWMIVTLRHSWHACTDSGHQAGCRCPGAKKVPGTQQPPWWLDVGSSAFRWFLRYWRVGILRDKSKYATSQWETSLQCNDVSHWLDAYLDQSHYDSGYPSQWLCRLSHPTSTQHRPSLLKRRPVSLIGHTVHSEKVRFIDQQARF